MSEYIAGNKRACLTRLAALLRDGGEFVLCTLLEARHGGELEPGQYALFSRAHGLHAEFGQAALAAHAEPLAEQVLAGRENRLAYLDAGVLFGEYIPSSNGEARLLYAYAAEKLANGERVLFVKSTDPKVASVSLFDEETAEKDCGQIISNFGSQKAGTGSSTEERRSRTEGFCEHASVRRNFPKGARGALSHAPDTESHALAIASRFHYDEIARFVYDPVFPEERLLILGGGGLDAAALAVMAESIGFSVTLASDDFPAAIERFRFDPACSVLVATRSYYDDFACLHALAGRRFRYAGCLGSARKSKLLFEELRHAGWTDELLARLHAPVGLAIGGALSAKELSFSIIAELIAVRHAPTALTARLAQAAQPEEPENEETQ